MAKVQLPPSLCPDCYLVDGIDTPMTLRPGQTLRCSRGHTWGYGDSDSGGSMTAMERFDQRQAMARHKRSQLAEKDPVKEAEIAANTTIVPLASQDTAGDIVIMESDKARIVELLGIDFTDGSSLCGSIRSLTMDIKALEDELRAARKVPEKGSADALNPNLQVMESGDLPVTIIVPEQYVNPLQEVAESNGTTIPEYLNSVLASSAFPGGWFF